MKDFLLAFTSMVILVVLSFGLFGIVGALAPDYLPDMFVVLVIGVLIVSLYFGVKRQSTLLVALGVTLPVVLLSCLGTISLQHHAPGIRGELVWGTVWLSVLSAFAGVVGGVVGRLLKDRYDRVNSE